MANSTLLWSNATAPDAHMLRYTARDDWQLDQRLLPHDLRATLAHVRGLGRIRVLQPAEVQALEGALKRLIASAAAGEFLLTAADEDGHSAIEAALTAELGDLGKKVHTGRSRNDQVLVALRLYEKEALSELAQQGRAGALGLLGLAERHALTPMPGYTHLQRAVPSSVGLWAAGIAESLADAVDAIAGARAQCDRCPLGTAAGYGVNLPLDREGVAAELGFSALAVNPLAAQASRGAIEVAVLAAAWQLMAAIRRFSWDLSLFCSAEFGFLRLPEAFTTGSSIMPNKKNPDVVELMRAACSVVQGAVVEVMSTLSLPSGYHRDLQLTKAPLLRGLDEALATATMLPRLLAGLAFDEQRMRAAIGADMFATDRAVELCGQGVPFRDAYRRAAQEVADRAGPLAGRRPEDSLKARVSPGACVDLRLDAIRARLAGAAK